MRKAHILQDNKTIRISNKFLFFDTETDEIKVDNKTIQTKLKLVCCIYWEKKHGKNPEKYEEKVFFNSDDFWRYVESKIYSKECLNVVAHNIDFDLANVKGYSYLQENGWIIKSFVDTNQLFILRAKKGNKTIVFIDTFNYFRTSVKEIGEYLGLPKLQIDFKTATMQELIEYSMRDVQIIYRIMREFLEFIVKHNLGNFKYTISSQSFSTFRHRFMKEKIYIHNRYDALEIERKAYFGGRTECFYIGEIKNMKLYKLDVNSMYPFVMKKYEYPVKLVLTLHNPSLEKIQDALKKYCVVGEFTLNVKEPVFPYRIKDKVIYPTGKGVFYLNTPEVKYALEKGYIESCKVLYCYEKARIFISYVNYFYEKRKKAKQQGNNVYSNFYKLLLNTLYGKFGQKGAEWRPYKVSFPPGWYVTWEVDYETGEKHTIRVLGNRVEKRIERGESYNSFPAIASHVTAYARMYLWKLINIAGRENVYYVDTDSIFTNDTGLKRLQNYIDNNKLGKLKIEDEATYLEIRGLKDYTFGKITKIKGVRKDATNIDVNIFLQQRFLHFRSRLREGNPDKYIIEWYQKVLKRKYEKGIIQPTGWVAPIEIGFDPKLFAQSILQ